MLEICVDSVESAIEASIGGANRIELCSSLNEGGLTPTVGLLKVIKKHVKQSVDVYTMLRPRNGNDFVYSDYEMNVIIEDIQMLKQNGANGFVFGALTPEGDVDVVKCKKVISECAPLPVTFHRAFDVCKKPFQQLEVLIEIGFMRVLTSGMVDNANLGCTNIQQLVKQANNRISIMPGCGITPANIRDILSKTGAKEVHASAKVRKDLNNARKIDICFGSYDKFLYVTDSNIVIELKNALNALT